MIIIGGNEYRIGLIDTFEQLKLARLLSPSLPIVEAIIAERNEEKDLTVPMMLLLGQLSEEDCEAVVRQCLSSVTRKQSSGWTKVMVNGVIMFSDITLHEMLQLSSSVITETLGDFFRTALSKLKDRAIPE